MNSDAFENVVFKRIFIEDVLENDIYASATKKDNTVWVNLFG
jgi:hypothetical protein